MDVASKFDGKIAGATVVSVAAFEEAYEGLCDAVERGKDTWLDPYAAEHPSEFFAVISEAFFEDPAETRRRYSDVYDQLKLFYRQDPLSR